MDKNLNGAFRKKKIYFSQVSNSALRDPKLSLKAKGLYALIQSYITIEEFTLYKSTLRSSCKEGEKSFESTWKELKDNGYLVQYRMQTPKGTYYYEYDLLDEADIELSNKVHASQNRKSKSEKIHNPKNEGMDNCNKTIPTKKEVMDKGPYGKGGVYNNTDYNNTYINNTNTSNSSSRAHLEEEFESNICELKKTTKVKFESILNNNNPDMILAVIEECSVTNVKSYRGFEVAFNSYIERNCKTREDVITAAAKYRTSKNKKSSRSYNKTNNKIDKAQTFNNFEPREYDYDSLETKLLGWDRD